MKIEIDQSGKIENTSKHTYLAFSNHQHFVLKVSAVEKRKLQKHFRSIGKPKIYVYAVFAVLLIILLKGRKLKGAQLVIDVEYQGRTELIKNFIKQYKPSFPISKIIFHRIGKKSTAHYFAYGAAINKIKPDIVVNAHQIITIIKKPGSA